MQEDILKVLRKITPEEQEILDGRDSIDKNIYNLNRSMIVDRAKLLGKGTLIELRPHTRFIHFPKHTHNYVEVVYMCEGQTRHIIDGEEIVLKAGELLFLSQYAVQEIGAASENDIAVNFIIMPEFFDRSLDMMGSGNNLIRDFLIECLKNGGQGMGYLHFKVADVLPIQNLMENLIWMLLHKQPNKRSLNQTTMGVLILHLLNHTDKVEIRKNHPEQEAVWAVLRFIEENYRDGELTFLAKQLGYSLYAISRLVKNMTGRTYTELLQEKRLNQAVYLLENTGLSITDISLDVGYSNFSYFYRIFRQRYNLSPRKYREQKGLAFPPGTNSGNISVDNIII